METFEAFIKRIVTSFNRSGIGYMFTGALAASYYGKPRTTMDVDIVVEAVSKDKMQDKLLQALEEAGVLVEKRKVEMVVESGFKIATFRDSASPFTLDIILSDGKLEKRRGTMLGLPTFYQAPEALILAKLRMIKATVHRERALKDEEDVKAILKFTEVNVNKLRKKALGNTTLALLEDILARRD